MKTQNIVDADIERLVRVVERNRGMDETERAEVIARLRGGERRELLAVARSVSRIHDATRAELDAAFRLQFLLCDVTNKGLKRLLEVYGFSVDQILDSVKPTVVSNDGTNAKVKVSFQMLGTPLDFESDMVQYEGRWYGKESLANIQKDAAAGSAAQVEGASGNG